MSSPHEKIMAAALLTCFACASSALAAQELQPAEEHMRTFLLSAKVIDSRVVSKGITGITAQRPGNGQGHLSDRRIFQDLSSWAVTDLQFFD